MNINTVIRQTAAILLLCCALGVDGAVVTGEFNQLTAATLIAGDRIQLDAPAGKRGWYWHGLVLLNDSSYDLRQYYALRFDVLNPGPETFCGRAEIRRAQQEGRKDLAEVAAAAFRVAASPQWQTVDLPITSFDYARGDQMFLKFIGQIRVYGQSGKAEIRNIRLLEAPTVKLAANIRSKAAENGQTEYEFTVKNCTDRPQSLRLGLEKRGWEGMPARLSADELQLSPGETRKVKLAVTVPVQLPAGAHERQLVKVTPLGAGTQTAELEFITVQRVPSPFLLQNAQGWQEVAAKIRQYDWARKEYAKILELANGWNPPEKAGVMSDQGTMGVVQTRYEEKLRSCVIAYKLTGEEKYLQKIRAFLLLFSNPKDGYPVLLHATSQGIPQEGGTFEVLSQAYDAIRDRLTPAECAQVENTMRLYVDTIIDRMGDSGISNWTIFNQVPAAFCALALHDIVRFNTLLYGPTGLIDQFRYGTMDDGWWFEMAITYNLHCAEGFTKLALAAQPFGIDLTNRQFPSSNTDILGRHPYEFSKYQGMNFQKFGPTKHNMLGFKAMWDGILPYPDYRGVMFGMGDGHEAEVAGNCYALAYYVFKDPRYAAILKGSAERDLIYGAGELPADTPKLYAESAHSDNAGIAVLRSQSGDIRNRIQVGFKYGTHGGYHGHFDRLSLLCMMRYGRGFYNPETSWYGYGSYLYKWWVQTSLSHNMVVVDGKMQEPTACRLLLFHSGRYLQAVGADSSARWSNPPYLGGYDKIAAIQAGTERYVEIPAQHPAIGEVTDYTEPVFQRRLQLVTDDYVVVADYLRSEQEHSFDQLLSLRGAQPEAGLKPTGHRNQFDASPLSSGQFIVNIDEYAMTAPAKVTSRYHFNAKGQNGRNQRRPFELTDDFFHEPGELIVDAYLLAPGQGQAWRGDYPESQAVAQQLKYEVKGDGRTLASGVLQTWILGRDMIDVDVTGVKELTLTTVKDGRHAADTLFWADAKLQTRDGKTIRLGDVKAETKGLRKAPPTGVDYYGGPVRIAGMPYVDTLGAEPTQDKQQGTLTFAIDKLHAVRLKAVVGGDFPAGQEENLRKIIGVHSVGRNAHFLTVLEPREGKARVASAKALDAATVEVKLIDGTTDRIRIDGLNDRKAIPTVKLYRNGKLLEQTEKIENNNDSK